MHQIIRNLPGSTGDGSHSADLDRLLTAYLNCLDETERVPAFSPWLYGRLFGQLLLWELAFIALFVTPFLDLIRLGIHQFAGPLPSPTRIVCRRLSRPFRGVWRGDISGLQVVRVRLLTRAFIGSRIVSAAEQLKIAGERRRLDALMRSPAAGDSLGELNAEREKLESLANVAKAQNTLGALIATGSASALPLGLAKLLMPAIVQFLPADVSEQIGAFVPLGQVLKAIGLAGDDSISLTPTLLAIGGGFLTFLLVTAMSCHIEKRRILEVCGAYAAEDAVLRPRGIAVPELPLDVAFAAGAVATGFLTMYVYAQLALAEPERSDQMQTAVSNLVVWLGVAVLVAIRRWYLRHFAARRLSFRQAVCGVGGWLRSGVRL
jgi:hypothetical protein